MASQYGTLLTTVQTQIESLNLTFGGQTASVLLKKLPQYLQGTALPALSTPIIFVSPSARPESVEPWTTEDEALVKYGVDVIVLAPGNRDASANLDTWLTWRQELRRLFQWSLTVTGGLASAFFAEVTPNPPLARDAMLKNYDVTGLGFRFWVAEPRTN